MMLSTMLLFTIVDEYSCCLRINLILLIDFQLMLLDWYQKVACVFLVFDLVLMKMWQHLPYPNLQVRHDTHTSSLVVNCSP